MLFFYGLPEADRSHPKTNVRQLCSHEKAFLFNTLEIKHMWKETIVISTNAAGSMLVNTSERFAGQGMTNIDDN